MKDSWGSIFWIAINKIAIFQGCKFYSKWDSHIFMHLWQHFYLIYCFFSLYNFGQILHICFMKTWQYIFCTNIQISFHEGSRRGPDPEIPGLITRNPKVPILKKSKSWSPKLKKKNSRIPKGSIPKSRA